MSITISPQARQIELDVSDAERRAFTVSTLDADGELLDSDVFGSGAKAKHTAEKLAIDSGLPLIVRTVHPAFD